MSRTVILTPDEALGRAFNYETDKTTSQMPDYYTHKFESVAARLFKPQAYHFSILQARFIRRQRRMIFRDANN